jgi:hypothetical protein
VPFVSLKLSKALANLPTKLEVKAARDAQRAFRASGPSGVRTRLRGPLLEGGGFYSDPVAAKAVRDRSFQPPRLVDWSSSSARKNRSGNREPVFVPFTLFSSREKRLLSRNPSRRHKDSLPSGDYELTPRRECVKLHYKLSLIHYHLQEIIDLMWVVSPNKSIVPMLTVAISLASGISRGLGTAGGHLRCLTAQLSYHRRWHRKLTSGQGRSSIRATARSNWLS